MATPREILTRAAAVHPSPVPRPPAPNNPIPAPAPIAARPVQPPAPTLPSPERITVPQPIRTNSVYRKLMQSHDRMHTRHLGG